MQFLQRNRGSVECVKWFVLALVALSFLILGFFLGSAHQQTVPAVQTTPTLQTTDPDAIHKMEMENRDRIITECVSFIEDYNRRSEHSLNERRKRAACGERLENTGLTRRELDAIADKRRSVKP
jgi:hypothetical protein